MFTDITSRKETDIGQILEYRGFNFLDGQLSLLKKYTKINFYDPWSKRMTIVEYEKTGYNKFITTYVDGTLAAQGTCLVEMVSPHGKEIPMFYDINCKDAKFYNRKGKMVSEIIDGTGIYTSFYDNGNRYWVVEYESYNQGKITVYNSDGTVSSESKND